MQQLFLADLAGYTDGEVRDHIASEYYEDPCSSKLSIKEDLEKYDICVAYESVGSQGCDSSSYFILQHRGDRDFYMFSGSHCSYYGFEGQYCPEMMPTEWFRQGNFGFYSGGYDDDAAANEAAIQDWINEHMAEQMSLPLGEK